MTDLIDYFKRCPKWLNRLRTKNLFLGLYLLLLLPSWLLLSFVFSAMNFVIGRDTSWALLVFIETFVVCYLLTVGTWKRLRERWRNASPLSEAETRRLINHGREIVETYGKRHTWERLDTLADSIGSIKHDEDLKIGALICAIVKEGGWESLPEEAYGYMVRYDKAWKPFAYYY